MVEETFLDPPITPAPIFAYRALRNVLFGSPEYSPEHENKENIPPANLVSKSPIKGAPKMILSQATNGAKSTTPKRKQSIDGGQMNAMLSPTKSCLRTPGIPTPRAELLRDINVTFKSVSPEVKRENELKQKQRGQIQLSVQSKTANDGKSNEQEKETTKAETPTKSLTAILPVPIFKDQNNYDLEAYIQRTEKEMKRLVKYGQKMREYARKQDEENAKLRQLLEEARTENQRLKKQINLIEPKKGTRQVPRIIKNEDLASGATASSIREQTTRKGEQDSSEFQFSRPTEKKSIKSLGTNEKQEVVSSLKAISTNPRPTNLIKEPSQDCVKLNIPIHLERQDSGYKTVSHGPEGNRNITPRRLAAARERVRRKRELRKTSTETVGDSQVDWAAL